MTASRPALALLGAILATLATDPVAAAAAAQSLTFTAGFGAAYDDNILEYSDAQLRDFESGIHPDRYSLDTRDDLVLSPSLGLAWERDLGAGRRHALRLRGEGSLHDRNGTADFHSVSAGWRESFRRDRRVSLGYYGIPRYYVRQLFDDDVVPAFSGLSRYRRSEFRLHIANAAWSQRVTRGTQAAVQYQFERRDYVRGFDERDSNLHEGQLSFGWTRLPRHGSASLLGAYRQSHARARDHDEQAGTTPDDPDIGYHGYSLGGAGRMEFGRRGRWRWGGDLDYVFEGRRYDSERPADRYHYGRRDTRHTAELGVRATWRPHWSLRAYDRLEDQVAHIGPVTGATTDAGSYRRNQVGLAIEWSATHRFSAAAAETHDAE